MKSRCQRKERKYRKESVSMAAVAEAGKAWRFMYREKAMKASGKAQACIFQRREKSDRSAAG